MIYLAANNTGCWKLQEQGFPIGMMMSPIGLRKPHRAGKWLPYALDNGLFHPFGHTPKPPEERLKIIATCCRVTSEQWETPLFVVVPDVPYDGQDSERISRYWLGVMRELFPNLPLAVAVQDGMTAGCLDGYDWCAVAGSTDWKLATLQYWVDESHRRGKRCHMLRVNTRERIRFARQAGCDSADGTGIWRGDRQQKRGVMEELIQQYLFAGEKETRP